MFIKKDGNEAEIKLKRNEKIIITVPASKGKKWVRLSVDPEGKLIILGNSEIIGGIIGQGMAEKIRNN